MCVCVCRKFRRNSSHSRDYTTPFVPKPLYTWHEVDEPKRNGKEEQSTQCNEFSTESVCSARVYKMPLRKVLIQHERISIGLNIEPLDCRSPKAIVERNRFAEFDAMRTMTTAQHESQLSPVAWKSFSISNKGKRGAFDWDKVGRRHGKEC